MSIKERNLLFRALKEAGIFSNYIEEAKKYAVEQGESAIKNIMSSSFKHAIDDPLYWCETKLGENFWDTVDEEFRFWALTEGEEKSFIADVVVAVRDFSDAQIKHRDNFIE